MNLSVLRISKILEEYFKNHHNTEDNFIVENIQSLAKGWQTELYSFKLYRENDNEKAEYLILRLYPGEQSFAKTKHEYNVLQTLFESGYPVPKVHILELDKEVLGYPFIIMERILGEDLGGIFTRSLENNDQKTILEKVLPQFTKLFVELHSINWKILAETTNYTEDKDSFYFIDRSLAKLEKNIQKNNIDELLPLLDWLKNNKEKGVLEKVSIVHKDFHPHNIVLDTNGKGFVIDWPDSFVGDYRQDLGWTLMLMEAYTSRELAEVFLDSYSRISGKIPKEMDYFVILSTCIRLLEVTLTIKLGSEGMGFREEAVEQIQDTVFHLRNLLVSLNEKIGLSIPEIEEMIDAIEHR